MSLKRRAAITGTAAISAVVLGAAPAMAHQCLNPNKQPGAGAQVIINMLDESMTFANPGIEARYTNGVTTQDTFRGLLGLDFDGDGDADVTTWIVGQNGEIPAQAQEAGAACNGVINFEAWEACLADELAG